jgi:hypothetical protein
MARAPGRSEKGSLLPQLLPALIAFAGVLVGSITTVGVQAYLDERNRDRESRIALQQATRLVDVEIGEILEQARVLQSPGVIGLRATREEILPSAAWRENRVILARALPAHTWELVSHFYSETATYRRLISPQGRLAKGIADIARQGFAELIEEGEKVRKALNEVE